VTWTVSRQHENARLNSHSEGATMHLRYPFVRAAAVACTAVVVASMAACGGGGGGGSTSGSTSNDTTGPITFVTGKDTSGYVQARLDSWNSAHPNEQARLIELPEDADAQRQRMIQNGQIKSNEFTVLNVDVVWTSEFAANGWIDQLNESDFPVADMLPPIVNTAKYFGKLYAVPSTSDGGMLYYRKDLLTAAGIAKPPTTWSEMIADCQKVQATNKTIGCYAGQFQKYEGLTVNVAEAINSAGGVITDENGKPNVNTPEAKKGLSFLADGFKNGYIPKAAITYKEEEGRRAFQAGELIFHRQWPYQYVKANLTDGSSKVAGKFAVAPLPGADGPGSSSLGGHNLAISKFANNKKSAREFVKFYTSLDSQKLNLTKYSNAPTYTSLYDDPALQQQFPYLPVLKQSIVKAVPRPRVVKYGDVTAAIEDAAYAALQGQKTVDQALSDLQAKLTELTKQ
jgi:multiple sugar transport system substrate-binding protein